MKTKQKAIRDKVQAMSWAGNAGDKGDDKVDPCGRGSWWRRTLKDTPAPGHYHIRDFLEEAELNPVKKTYGFRGVGRRAPTLGRQRADVLLPAARDSSPQAPSICQPSHFFRNCPRPDVVTLGVRDKHIHTSPCDYNLTSKPVEKTPCRHVMFRSTVQRISFPPREGLPPCHYNPQTAAARGITSCFKSTVPRLHRLLPSTPGPGAYEPCWNLGDPLNSGTEDASFSLLFRAGP
ncbi:protein STPG4 [Nelusetta ayraudi]|uniref:protein STPG4 n=1 Tax=Nelusetta ayraudi TaxID=303726 RepID=UPI003F70CB99